MISKCDKNMNLFVRLYQMHKTSKESRNGLVEIHVLVFKPVHGVA